MRGVFLGLSLGAFVGACSDPPTPTFGTDGGFDGGSPGADGGQVDGGARDGGFDPAVPGCLMVESDIEADLDLRRPEQVEIELRFNGMEPPARSTNRGALTLSTPEAAGTLGFTQLTPGPGPALWTAEVIPGVYTLGHSSGGSNQLSSMEPYGFSSEVQARLGDAPRFVWNLDHSVLNARLFLNGGPPPDATSLERRGRIALSSEAGSSLTRTLEVPGSGAIETQIALFHGSYRLVWSDAYLCGTEGPCGAAFVSEPIQVQGDTSLDLQARSHILSGSVTLDGQPLDAAQAANLTLNIWGEGEPRADFGFLEPDGSFSVELMEATYDVLVSGPTALAADGITGTATVAEGLVLDRDRQVQVDLRTVQVEVPIFVNGSPIDEASNHQVGFAARVSDRVFPVGNVFEANQWSSSSGSVSLRVFAGRYHVYWLASNEDCPDRLPCVDLALSDVDFRSDGTVPVQIETHTIDLELLLNGQPWPSGEARGSLALWVETQDATASRPVSLPTEAPAELSLHVPASSRVQITWTPDFGPECGSTGLPCGPVLLADLQVEADLRHTVDLRPVRWSGRVLLEGAPLPAGPRGRIEAWSQDRNVNALLSMDADGRFDGILAPGAYAIHYRPPTECAPGTNLCAFQVLHRCPPPE